MRFAKKTGTCLVGGEPRGGDWCEEGALRGWKPIARYVQLAAGLIRGIGPGPKVYDGPDPVGPVHWWRHPHSTCTGSNLRRCPHPQPYRCRSPIPEAGIHGAASCTVGTFFSEDVHPKQQTPLCPSHPTARRLLPTGHRAVGGQWGMYAIDRTGDNSDCRRRNWLAGPPLVAGVRACPTASAQGLQEAHVHLSSSIVYALTPMSYRL